MNAMEDSLILIVNPFHSSLEKKLVEIIIENTSHSCICIEAPEITPSVLANRPSYIFVLLEQCHYPDFTDSRYENFFLHFQSVPTIAILDSQNKCISCQKFIWSFITVPFTSQDILLNIDWYLSDQQIDIEHQISFSLKRLAEHDLLKGESPALLNVKAQILRVARYDVTVLLCGETGTGKELCARMIHFFHHDSSKPFVPVNCGAVPEELFENELFGHKKGAYTHASDTEGGLVKAAQGGTLFLDEIEVLSRSSQVKLLRFIEEKRFKPLGQSTYVTSNVRIIAAAKENLRDLVQAHQFREDLYYRLNVVQVNVPPLRERREDIPLLARHFVRMYSNLYEKPLKGLSSLAILKLSHYGWPGNVRELENIIQDAVVNSTGEWIEPRNLKLDKKQISSGPPNESFQAAKRRSIEAFERNYLTNLLASSHGNISQAAKFAQKDRWAFCRLLKKYHIDANRFRK